MKEPFPELTHLNLSTIKISTVLVLPDSFLGGYAPRLRTLKLDGLSFRQCQKRFRLSVTLSNFTFGTFPHSGYISPEAMVARLSTLIRLERLSIESQSPRSHPDQLGSPRSIRTVLPSLNFFEFRGVSEYLEDLTSRIDAPQLGDLHITFFNQLVFNIPQLCSFISRAEKLRSHDHAKMTFARNYIKLDLIKPGRIMLELTIRCQPSDWQLSSLTQVCDSPFLSLLNPERLDICENPFSPPHWQELEHVEHTQWLELLHPFTTVKSLYLSSEFTPRVVPALQELSGDGIMDVLPALRTISLPRSSPSRSVREAIMQFVTGRWLSGHTVAVIGW
ncbi:hypothetical protein BC826DRAFT_1176410 [Russula brevipes]|nr:hypothetical protein BC826DRAFT_1176410 [Russula brevipes]